MHQNHFLKDLRWEGEQLDPVSMCGAWKDREKHALVKNSLREGIIGCGTDPFGIEGGVPTPVDSLLALGDANSVGGFVDFTLMNVMDRKERKLRVSNGA